MSYPEAWASLTSLASRCTNGRPDAVALEPGADCGAAVVELGGDCGAVGGGSTAAELQAAVVSRTEIHTNTSLIRDHVSPKVEICMSTSVALLA